MATPRVQLLGPARVLLSSGAVAFEVDKRYQCLGYLAWKGDWVRRDELAFLFWPDVDTARARHSLRQLIRRVRALPWAPEVEPERQRIRWRARTDVAELMRLVAARDLGALLSVYKGDLLAGMSGLGSGEFTAWLQQEREHLRTTWRGALLRHAGELDAASKPEEAVAVIQTVLARDPLDEEAVRALLRLGMRLRDRGSVMEAYHAFGTRLEEELGLAPTVETQRLADALGTVMPGHVTATTALPNDAGVLDDVTLPTTLTSFVGRERELAEVRRLLADPECRLLTLTGFGGAGKTRLALRAAETLRQHYPDGAVFIDLTAVDQPEAVPAAIAARLRLTLEGKSEPVQELANALGSRRLLLVLDSFEHLVGGAGLVAKLLSACPGLQVVVTSRALLGLKVEWVLAVPGLGYPPETEGSLDDALRSDAVRLLLQRAGRVRPGFEVGEADLPYALRLCRIVDGSPLALELAAAWLRAISLRELVTEVDNDLDFLQATDGPSSQRSLRAVFERSWRLLGSSERRGLGSLSVFHGGFSRDAATYVAGVPMVVLAALVDRSLVRMTPEGRYVLHPLVRGYAHEKLSRSDTGVQQALRRHAEFYGQTLRRLEVEAGSPAHGAALRTFELELDNVRAAWRYLSHKRSLPELKRSTWLVRDLFDRTRRFREGVDLLQATLDALADADEHRQLVGIVQTNQAWLYYRMGRYVEAGRLAEAGLAKLSARRDSRETKTGLNVLGAVAIANGDYAGAKAAWAKALDLSANKPRASAAFLNNVALAEEKLGEFRRARRHLEAALAINRELGDRARIANNLNAMAELQLELGDPGLAAETFQEALEVAEKYDHRQVIPHVLHGLARAHGKLGHPRRALRYGDRAIAMFRDGDERSMLALALTERGRAALRLGQLSDAEASIGEGLELAVASGSVPDMLTGLEAVAELHLARSNSEEAHSVLSLIAVHDKGKRADGTRNDRRSAEERTGACSRVGFGLPEDLGHCAQEQLRRLGRFSLTG